MILSRRDLCHRAGILLAGTALASFARLSLSAAYAQDASAADLAVAGPMGDMVLGDEKAPVTIIEYASMTCSHCAHFQETTFPELKKRYIDTGKVRYILREFPLDPLAAAGFMLARCSANNDPVKYYAFVDMLFAQQKTWVVQKPLEPLKTLSRQAGISNEQFEDCLKNQSVIDSIEKVRQHGTTKLKIDSTPTFFINGKRQPGDISIDELTKMIEPLIKT